MASIPRPLALLSLALCVLSSPTPGGRSTDDPSHIVHDLDERGTCKDNLGRCFNPTGPKPKDIASRSAATAFCSSFLSIPVVTSVIGTDTPSTVITVTTTVVASTEVQTSIAISDIEATETTQTTVTTTLMTEISSATEVTSITTEETSSTAEESTSATEETATMTEEPTTVTEGTITATEPTTTITDGPVKRDVSPATLPNCATGRVYADEELSSACSCISVTASTVYVTATAAVATDTAVDTVSITTTTVTVGTSTATTGTTTVIETETETVTPTPTPSPTTPASVCTDGINPYIVDGKSYTVYCDQYYYDYGHAIAQTTGVATLPDCLQFCADTPGCLYAYWVSPDSFYGDKLYCYAFDRFLPESLGASAGVDSFSLNVEEED